MVLDEQEKRENDEAWQIAEEIRRESGDKISWGEAMLRARGRLWLRRKEMPAAKFKPETEESKKLDEDLPF